ncbi:RNA-directed DNA polymerase, eukaryota, reverse transcriptase zinc-binding domain protein [Tanacetum coccineum]
MQIPTKKVGLVIGKGGETIKNMQASTGARIKECLENAGRKKSPLEILDAPSSIPSSYGYGNPSKKSRYQMTGLVLSLVKPGKLLTKAEQLTNEVLAKAELGGSDAVSQRVGSQPERAIHIDGTSDQIEAAKQMVEECLESARKGKKVKRVHDQEVIHAADIVSQLQPLLHDLGTWDIIWKWLLDDNAIFSIKALMKLVEEKCIDVGNNIGETMWNKLVPKKGNIFMWRVGRGRLPDRVELDNKGIDLHTLLCPSCDEACETIDHSLVLCNEAMNIWEKLFQWWKTGNVNSFSTNEIFRLSSSVLEQAIISFKP